MKKIAVIGTGIMGSGMASNYLKNGYEVVVWNRSGEKLKPLIGKGAMAVSTPKEAAEKADIIFDVTANDEASRAVWLGEEGIFAGADKKKVLIASGTFTAEWVDELAEQCSEKGFTFFDMPLTGSRMGAENGALTMLVGGDEKKLDAVKPDLAAISQRIFYFGKAGAGIRFKLVLNMFASIHVLGFGEVLKIAKNAGLDIPKTGEALAAISGDTMTNLSWKNLNAPPDPINFSRKWIAKDLDYAKKLAAPLETPFLDEAVARFQKEVHAGHGDEEWTTIIKEGI